MHAEPPTPSEPLPPSSGWWGRELSRYQWFVFVVACLGWLFDTMDQQLFVLARNPAIRSLTKEDESIADPVQRKAEFDARVARHSGNATAIFILGWATGGLVFGMFGDRWGRARTMLLTIVVYSVFTGLSALSTTWWDFSIYRFLTGLGVGGEFAAGVSLVAEVMPPRARPYALGLLQALSAVGNIGAAVISLIVPPSAEIGGLLGWRWMFLIGVLPSIMVLFVMGRLREPDSYIRAREALARGTGGDEATKQLGDIGEMFRDPRWRRNTIVGVTLAVAGVMGLWGVGFWTPELIRNNVFKDASDSDKNFYSSVAMILQNAGGFFGVYGFSVLTGLFGRRPAFAASYLLAFSGIFLVFGFMTRPDQIWWMVPLLGFCTLFVFGGFAIYFAELFPTRLRSTGVGFCYNVARFLAAFAPFLLGQLTALFAAPAGSPRAAEKLSEFTLLSSLGSVDDPFRYAALSVATLLLLGLVVLPWAPETKDKPLPE